MQLIRTALPLLMLAAPASAAEPTFTKDEVQAAYAIGRADAVREQLNGTPAGRSLAKKMKPAPEPPKKP